MNTEELKNMLKSYSFLPLLSSYKEYKEFVNFLDKLGDTIICSCDFTSHNSSVISRGLGLVGNTDADVLYGVINIGAFNKNPIKKIILSEMCKTSSTTISEKCFEEIKEKFIYNDFLKYPNHIKQYIYEMIIWVSFMYYNIRETIKSEPEWDIYSKKYPFITFINLSWEEFFRLYEKSTTNKNLTGDIVSEIKMEYDKYFPIYQT